MQPDAACGNTKGTFIAIHKGLLYHYRLPIDRVELFCLGPVLAHIAHLFRAIGRRRRHLEHMASQEFIAAGELGERDPSLTIVTGQKNFGSRYQENL